MKKLALVLDLNDAEWLVSIWKNRGPEDEVVVIAPNFNGRIVADSLGVPYKTYEEISWSLDKLAITDESRMKARNWYELDEMKNNVFVQAIQEFNGYPLFSMCQSLLFLAVQEVIQAHQIISQIVTIEKPDQFLFNNRNNPFYGLPISFIADCHTVEREVVKSFYTRKLPSNERVSQFLQGVDPFLSFPVLPVAEIDHFSWASDFTGPKILIYAMGGYHYFDYILFVLEQLLNYKARVCIVIMESWELALPFRQTLHDKGAYLINRSSLTAVNEQDIWIMWKKKCEKAVESIYASSQLEEHFSDSLGTYYPGLVSDFLCKQIMDSASIVVDLMRAETLVSAFAPEMVLYHANIHYTETCDILPARKLGIPTLAIDHGVNGYLDSQRMTFATEFYGVSGLCLKEGLMAALQADESVITVLGNTRCEKITLSELTKREAKKKFGFDPERPVCIYCDQGGWSHTYEWRHSTYDSLNAILDLKKSFPDLQIIYRIHQGIDESGKRLYLKKFANPDFYFQMSLDPLLTEIAPAADLVIAHYTSAVAETLLCGVPVIYLTAHGEPEPSYYGCEAIAIAESFEMLPKLVSAVLDTQRSREDIRRLAQPFFDKALAGNDGSAAQKLVQWIFELAMRCPQRKTAGFQDWLDRIDASSCFNTKEFRTLIVGNSLENIQFVSVVIPSYNRAHMIGTTLESFINQNYPKDRYEIIVVDNNSSDSTKEVVLEWKRKSPITIQYLFESRPGAHFARNSAAKVAIGRILYFTDDDMIADCELLSEITRVFNLDPMIGTATGRVLPKWETPPPEWIIKLCNNGYLSLQDLGDGVIIEDEDLGVWSCHQAIKRDVFFESGGFNPDIVNGEAIGDNETGLNIKIRQLGYKFGYNGKSVIYHMIPPARMTQDYLNKRLANQGSADSYTEYKKHRFAEGQLNERIQDYVKKLLEHSARSVTKRQHGDVTWRMDKAFTYYYLSRVEYDLRLIADPSWRDLVIKNNWIEECTKVL